MTIITSFFDNLNKKRIILIFFSLGFLIYGNSLFNSFIGDDSGQVKDNPVIRSIWNIPNLFIQGTFNVGDLTQKQYQNYYKPVLSTTFSLIYQFSGNHPFGFHLIQLLIHITNSILIYFLFLHFFKPQLSLALSLIFLTHPLNTETVVYISALQEPLFLLFGLLAIYISMKEHTSFYRTLLITILLALSLLSKETGVVFLLVVPVFQYLYQKQTIIWGLMQSLIASLIYAFLRFIVAQIYFTQIITVPIQTLSFWERIVHAPKIFFFYLSTFFYPKDLFVFQSWTVNSLSLKEFYIPLIIGTLIFAGIIIFSLIVYRTYRDIFKELLFFLILFGIGLVVHLQIIPLDQTVADRWFYFPMVGLLGIIGSVITYLNSKRWLNIKLVMPIVFVILILLSARAIIRNMNWKDPGALYTHDLKYDQTSYQLVRVLGSEYFNQGKLAEAKAYYVRATHLFPSSSTFSSLGKLYLATKRYKEAEEAYETALKYEPNLATSWLYLAIAKQKLGNKEGALEAARKLYSIAPNKTTSYFLKVFENNLEVILK